MIKSIPLSRAAVRAAFLTLGVLALAPACTAAAFTPAAPKTSAENTPLNLAPSKVGAHTSAGGPSIVRTIVGLLIVIAVIWGLTWILKQVKSGRDVRAGGVGLESVATLPLGSNRSLHLVRAGEDYLLLGSAEHGLVPIHRYTEQQAREAGLLESDQPQLGGESHPRGSIQMPGQHHGLLERLREWTVRR